MRKFRAVLIVLALLLCQSAFAADESYIIGRVRNGMYTNQSLGVRAYFGENWKILSRREIARLNGVVMSASPTLAELTNGKVPSFCAVTADNTAIVTIEITNLGVMGSAVVSESVNEELDALIRQISGKLSQAYSEMGYTDVKIDRANVTFTGRKYPGIIVTAKAKGVPLYQKQAVCIKGEYCYQVTATSTRLDITDKLLGMFRRTGS
ncbi:MAG: hypothetical protein IJR63_09470 [Synergistaceae bacterium]|nr:hypothetical protein [Synergistaceae bacterium]